MNTQAQAATTSATIKKVNGIYKGYAANGSILTGQHKVNGHWYLFNRSSGAMTHGLVKDTNGKTYYFNPGSGMMMYGTQNIGGIT